MSVILLVSALFWPFWVRVVLQLGHIVCVSLKVGEGRGRIACTSKTFDTKWYVILQEAKEEGSACCAVISFVQIMPRVCWRQVAVYRRVSRSHPPWFMIVLPSHCFSLRAGYSNCGGVEDPRDRRGTENHGTLHQYGESICKKRESRMKSAARSSCIQFSRFIRKTICAQCFWLRWLECDFYFPDF